MEAAVRLFHIREKEQLERLVKAVNSGEDFENTNADKIWHWGYKRWKKAFADKEFELRDS